MLWLNPTEVVFDGAALDGVIGVTIDRDADEVIAERDAAGPHIVFADVPAPRAVITITRRLDRSEETGIRPGDAGALTFRAALGRSDAGARAISAQAVALSIRTTLREKGAEQRLTFIGVSPDGVADPVTIETEVH